MHQSWGSYLPAGTLYIAYNTIQLNNNTIHRIQGKIPPTCYRLPCAARTAVVSTRLVINSGASIAAGQSLPTLVTPVARMQQHDWRQCGIEGRLVRQDTQSLVQGCKMTSSPPSRAPLLSALSGFLPARLPPPA